MISGILVCMQASECCRWLDSRLIGSTLPYMGAPRGGAPYPGAPEPPLEHLDIGAQPPHQDMEPVYARAKHGTLWLSQFQVELHIQVGASRPWNTWISVLTHPTRIRNLLMRGQNMEHCGRAISRWSSISRWAPTPLEHLDIESSLEAPPSEDALG